MGAVGEGSAQLHSCMPVELLQARTFPRRGCDEAAHLGKACC